MDLFNLFNNASSKLASFLSDHRFKLEGGFGSLKPKNPKEYNKYFDHTILKPDARKTDVRNIVDQAVEYGFYSVCINPCYVGFVSKHLAGTQVKVCTVSGFPLGSNTTESKRLETREALKNGADEIDMVINIGALKDEDYEYVYEDIKAISKECKKFNATLKVILETCLLTKDEIAIASILADLAGANMVKTSTGFSTSGAKAEDVSLMSFCVSSNVSVKASGGISSKEDFFEMIEAGCSRIGASKSVNIIRSI